MADRELLDALETGYVERVAAALASGANANSANESGKTALMLSVGRHFPPTVPKLLLDAGAAVDAKDKNGNTALLLAAANGNAPAARLLLDAGADVNAENIEGHAALVLAAYHGNFGAVRALLSGGANVSVIALFQAKTAELHALMQDAAPDYQRRAEAERAAAAGAAAGAAAAASEARPLRGAPHAHAQSSQRTLVAEAPKLELRLKRHRNARRSDGAHSE